MFGAIRGFFFKLMEWKRKSSLCRLFSFQIEENQVSFALTLPKPSFNYISIISSTQTKLPNKGISILFCEKMLSSETHFPWKIFSIKPNNLLALMVHQFMHLFHKMSHMHTSIKIPIPNHHHYQLSKEPTLIYYSKGFIMATSMNCMNYK